MGNRGILHDAQDRVIRRWASKSWVCCSLSETFQKRMPFSPGTYSELFFLDEATAYAAGHRPCRTCRRQAHDQFNAIWTAANGASQREGNEPRRLSIRDIDAVLHAERLGADKRKRTHRAKLGDLPVSVMSEAAGEAILVSDQGLRRWSFAGYQQHPATDPGIEVDVLTPPSIVAAIRLGLPVALHPSASS
jgi:hypothetical protein